jgi:glycosyltransferase involved in cell wall biosynthesis
MTHPQSRLRVLLWHVHGSWTTAFVHGRHEYLLPVLPDRGPDGLGRARTWDWPDAVRERSPQQLRGQHIDAVVLQRPGEIELTEQWTGRRPGTDLPSIYLEHNAPDPHPVHSRHPLAERDDIPIVHVTHFNQLFWDNGRAPTTVVEHGIPDPGERYTGELARSAVVINEPARRGRMVGTDLLGGFARQLPIDLFGMPDRPPTPVLDLPGVRVLGDVPQQRMHAELARRRVYVHTTRWTSLGLALIEAMQLAMPVVALASTETSEAIPPGAGLVSTDLSRLHTAVAGYRDDLELARLAGKAARDYALERYGLARFLVDWDQVLHEVTR